MNKGDTGEEPIPAEGSNTAGWSSLLDLFDFGSFDTSVSETSSHNGCKDASKSSQTISVDAATAAKVTLPTQSTLERVIRKGSSPTASTLPLHSARHWRGRTSLRQDSPQKVRSKSMAFIGMRTRRKRSTVPSDCDSVTVFQPRDGGNEVEVADNRHSDLSKPALGSVKRLSFLRSLSCPKPTLSEENEARQVPANEGNDQGDKSHGAVGFSSIFHDVLASHPDKWDSWLTETIPAPVDAEIRGQANSGLVHGTEPEQQRSLKSRMSSLVSVQRSMKNQTVAPRLSASNDQEPVLSVPTIMSKILDARSEPVRVDHTSTEKRASSNRHLATIPSPASTDGEIGRTSRSLPFRSGPFASILAVNGHRISSAEAVGSGQGGRQEEVPPQDKSAKMEKLQENCSKTIEKESTVAPPTYRPSFDERSQPASGSFSRSLAKLARNSSGGKPPIIPRADKAATVPGKDMGIFEGSKLATGLGLVHANSTDDSKSDRSAVSHKNKKIGALPASRRKDSIPEINQGIPTEPDQGQSLTTRWTGKTLATEEAVCPSEPRGDIKVTNGNTSQISSNNETFGEKSQGTMSKIKRITSCGANRKNPRPAPSPSRASAAAGEQSSATSDHGILIGSPITNPSSPTGANDRSARQGESDSLTVDTRDSVEQARNVNQKLGNFASILSFGIRQGSLTRSTSATHVRGHENNVSSEEDSTMEGSLKTENAAAPKSQWWSWNDGLSCNKARGDDTPANSDVASSPPHGKGDHLQQNDILRGLFSRENASFSSRGRQPSSMSATYEDVIPLKVETTLRPDYGVGRKSSWLGWRDDVSIDATSHEDLRAFEASNPNYRYPPAALSSSLAKKSSLLTSDHESRSSSQRRVTWDEATEEDDMATIETLRTKRDGEPEILTNLLQLLGVDTDTSGGSRDDSFGSSYQGSFDNSEVSSSLRESSDDSVTALESRDETAVARTQSVVHSVSGTLPANSVQERAAVKRKVSVSPPTLPLQNDRQGHEMFGAEEDSIAVVSYIKLAPGSGQHRFPMILKI
jgi:hypothetical protein